MTTAQKLYENGYITYMRTDSLNLSQDALDMIKTYIKAEYGDEYLNIKQYKNKDGNCQEAHEAIRPCSIDMDDISHDDTMTPYEIKLYKLIWRRTVASQMTACKVELITAKIEIEAYEDIWFVSKAEKILFDGFQRVYIQTTATDEDTAENAADDDDAAGNTAAILLSLKKGDKLTYKTITATEKISKPKHTRYTEASLIKKLDSLDIGRPSTYANMVAVVQDRKYVDKKDVIGKNEKISIAILKSNIISESKTTVKVGGEKNKLVPNEIGEIVNAFMNENFDNIINYKYTSNLEKKLDAISAGDAQWVDIVSDSYNSFEPICAKLNSQPRADDKHQRIIGKHPETDMDIICYIGKYGPVAKYNNKFAPLGEFKMDAITIEQAIGLFQYPKQLTDDIIIKKGKYGLYFEHSEKKYTLKDIDAADITEKLCLEIVSARGANGTNLIKKIGKDITINKGKYGVYINYKNKNYGVYDKNPAGLTKERCMEIISKKKSTKSKPKK
jgi:DNA topoisomerase-1